MYTLPHVCVCMHASVCMCASMYVRVYMHVCVHACMCMCLHVCVHTCVHVRAPEGQQDDNLRYLSLGAVLLVFATGHFLYH